ncbi:hypothetical protein ENSA5_08600 [Enhygromyxa salina]|uniref:Uncharacterized protein n=1 Tax=Enhygromyxa salina TaxID=215803 RepID=A0A2S9YGV9_9BACT|nr:hypothetical protein [Enhygromyxa salina]PRQ04329.1 hypothetical protein ENSA5_08600 [Enhygromyxa salina]
MQAKAAKSHARGVKKLGSAAGIAAKANLPKNPKRMDKAKKLEAISKFEAKLARSDKALLDGVRLILESNRAERRAGLSMWAVELSDQDFPVAVSALDATQQERDEKLLGQIEKALKRGRSSAVAVAKKHKNQH